MSAMMVAMAVLIRTFSFRDTCRKRRNINLILDVTPTERNHMGLQLENEVKTPTIIFNNPVQQC